MIVKRYQAKNLKVAIHKAKLDLGSNAKMIHVRQLDNCDNSVEIIAALEEDDKPDVYDSNQIQDEVYIENSTKQLPDKSQNLKSPKSAFHISVSDEDKQRTGQKMSHEEPVRYNMATNSYIQQMTNIRPSQNSSNKLPPSSRPIPDNTGTDPLLQSGDLTNVSTRVRSMSEASEGKIVRNNRRALQTLHEYCLKNQVDSDITYEILSMLNDDSEIDALSPTTPSDCLSLFISKQINVSGGLKANKKTAIFIGPTGVGKTTTLAKLAAQYHFQQEKAVGIITIDAYRIAAIEQLKTYAQIMSLPFKVALTPEELKLSIKNYKDMDLILVDTPGRSQFNMEALKSLEEFLDAAQPADTHLLISLNMRESDAYATVENFAPQHVQQLIFTKLDETSVFGSILNIIKRARKPVSYFTTGQNVPDDIEVAKHERIVDLFFNLPADNIEN